LSAAIAAVAAYGAAPAVANSIHVTADAPDAVASDGKCSLREAVNAANENSLVNAPDCDSAGASSGDLIVLPAGQYTLAAGGAGDNANATGDLDLTGAVAVRGAGASSTAIVGNGDRVVDVQPNASARLIGVTIRGGTTPAAADSAVDGVSGTSAVNGAGVLNQGTLTVADSVITQNTTGAGGDGGLGAAGGGGGSGAGIASPGPLALFDTTVSDNTTGG